MITNAFSERSTNWLANARFAEGLRALDDYGTTGSTKILADAEETFREAVETDPEFQNGHFHLAVARELAGHHDAAIAEFEGLLDRASEAPPLELLYNLGLAWFHLYRKDAYEKALSYFDRAIAAAGASHSDAAEQRRATLVRLLAGVGKAQVHAHQALPETGLTPAQTAVAATNARLEASQVLKELEKIGQPEKQRKDEVSADQSLLKDAKWGALNALGHVCMTEGRAGDASLLLSAIRYFCDADLVDPGNFRIQSNLGSAHFFLAADQDEAGNLRKAQAAFDRVLAMRPNYDFAYYRLAGIANSRKEFDKAESYLAKAREHPSEMTPGVLDRLAARISEARKTVSVQQP